MKKMITKEEALFLFDYSDGNIFWKNPKSNRLKVGQKAGWPTGNPAYLYVCVGKIKILVHRLIFLMHHGSLPETVDHIDGNPLNNKIENLRAATRTQNQCNMKKPSNNSSGIKNVSWNKCCKKWDVRISVNKTQYCFGLFENLEDAARVADEMRKKFHGEFARAK